MNRACKNADRMTPKTVTRAEMSASAMGPAKFDGRANMGAKATKAVVNKAGKTADRPRQASRI